jgi:hypothetical protein
MNEVFSQKSSDSNFDKSDDRQHTKLHFFHVKDMYHFQKKKLQELVESGEAFDTVTRHRLVPYNTLRQCTR